MSTIHPKHSTEMHQNTTFYAELNREHAGEGFVRYDQYFKRYGLVKLKIMEFPKLTFDLS